MNRSYFKSILGGLTVLALVGLQPAEVRAQASDKNSVKKQKQTQPETSSEKLRVVRVIPAGFASAS